MPIMMNVVRCGLVNSERNCLTSGKWWYDENCEGVHPNEQTNERRKKPE